MHHLSKRKSKGVSEIIAVVLMILMVTTVGFSVLALGMGYFSGTASAREFANKLNIDTLREHFIIVDVNFTDSGLQTNVSVAIYNYCDLNIRMVVLYLNGTQLGALQAPSYITPGTVVIVNGTYPGSVGGNPQLIRVVSSLGNNYEKYYFR